MPRHKANASQPAPLAVFTAETPYGDANGLGVQISTHAAGIAPRIHWDRYAPSEQYTGNRATLPVVLVHGANHAAAIYAQWGQYLAGLGFTVYAIDLRGHGRSTMPPGERVSKAHLWQYADDIATLVQTEGLQAGKFVLAGHSLGGAVVQLYARNHPITGLVILASTALPRFLQSFVKVGRHAPITYLQAMFLGPQYLFDTPTKIRRFLLEADADDASVQRVQEQLCGETTTMAAECLRWMRERRHQLRADQILVLGGQNDTLFSAEELQHCAGYYGAIARVQVVPATPHDLMAGRTWQRCADYLAHFVAACGAVGRPAV